MDVLREEAADGPASVPASSAPARRTCLLVLGMHRSGTSALTRVLSLLGAALPKNLLGSGPGNETGHWEPERLMQLHDQMLVEAGSSWDDWRRLDLATQLPADRLDHYKSEIRRLLEEEYDDAPLFVVKEPRICRFVPLYQEVMAGMGVALRPVLIFRHPLEVAASLEARDGMQPAQSLLYWLRHVLDAEQASRDLPRAIASYAALLGDWRSTIAPFESELRLVWPHKKDNIAAEVDGFLSPTHRHHAADEAALATTPAVSDWVRRAHAAVNRLRNDAAVAMAELDAIGREFNAGADLFSASLAAERMARDQALATQHSAFATSLASAHAERDGRAAEAEQVRSELVAERQKNAEDLAALRQQAETEREQHAAALAATRETVVNMAVERVTLNVEACKIMNQIDDKLCDDLISSLFQLPDKLVPTAWAGHIPFLFFLFRSARPRTFVELGVHYGASFIAACSAAKKYATETTCYGIDTWQGDMHAGHYDGDNIFEELKSYLNEFYPPSELLRGTFDSFLPQFPDGGVDILHIDGLHTYEAIRHDFESWLPKLSESGIVLFHDVCVHERGFGVWKLWEEVSNRYPSLTFSHSFGLGVLLVGSKQPPIVQSIVNDLRSGPVSGKLFASLCANLGASLPERYRHACFAPASAVSHGDSPEALSQLREIIKYSRMWKLTWPVTRLSPAYRRLRELCR